MSSVEPEKIVDSCSIDSEKQLDHAFEPIISVVESVGKADDGVNRSRFASLWRLANWLDSFGVEVRGVERVEQGEGKRTHTFIYDSATIWAGANVQISTLALGTLATPIFGLGLIDAALTILFFNLIGTLPVAIFSTWGAQTGLRQMVLSRFSFGRYPIFFPLFLNLLACIGFSTVNTIVGAGALAAVGKGVTTQLPIAGGVVVIATCTMCIALFGYKYIHIYEKWSAVPNAIIFLILLGFAASSVTTSLAPASPAETGGILSFGAAVVGFSLGWASLGADYTVNMPHDTPALKIFFCTYIGLNMPIILIEILGVALTNTFDARPDWGDIFNNPEAGGSVGGLINAILTSRAGPFGSFLTVVLAMSIVANNIPNLYSFALTFQAFGRFAQAIPRFFLVIIGTIIYVVLAIAGANNFVSALTNLLVILSYWLSIYCVILLEEHYIFKAGSWSNYDLENWNDASKMPLGLATTGAVIWGAIGAVLGMAQVLYIGVLGGKIGDPEYGGDIGFLLSAGFSAIAYPIFRYFELKFIGR